jgi:hypothetical protein
VGGSEALDWAVGLEASFEAALAREDEVAADDLAFSLRQDVDVRDAAERSGCGWRLVLAGEAGPLVDEVGIDYVRAGTLLVRTRTATLRSAPGPSPRRSERALLEVLAEVARAGTEMTVNGLTGRPVRVAKDHVAVRQSGSETIVGLDAVQSVRLDGGSGYSASRGLSG